MKRDITARKELIFHAQFKYDKYPIAQILPEFWCSQDATAPLLSD